jgi:hypothetical protein
LGGERRTGQRLDDEAMHSEGSDVINQRVKAQRGYVAAAWPQGTERQR